MYKDQYYPRQRCKIMCCVSVCGVICVCMYICDSVCGVVCVCIWRCVCIQSNRKIPNVDYKIKKNYSAIKKNKNSNPDCF